VREAGQGLQEPGPREGRGTLSQQPQPPTATPHWDFLFFTVLSLCSPIPTSQAWISGSESSCDTYLMLCDPSPVPSSPPATSISSSRKSE
jgi:hypothetical protein